MAVLKNPEPIPGHGQPTMPNWGEVLRRIEGNDRVAQERLEALVAHIESLQVK